MIMTYVTWRVRKRRNIQIIVFILFWYIYTVIVSVYDREHIVRGRRGDFGRVAFYVANVLYKINNIFRYYSTIVYTTTTFYKLHCCKNIEKKKKSKKVK